MRGVGTLVAEVAVDLVHPLDAADDGALQEQLGSDPQEQLGVEGIRVRGERTSARTAVDGLQHRRLHLEVAVAREGRTQGGNRRRPRTNCDARLLAGDEVEVALAHPGLVAQLGVEVRQRQDRFGRDGPVRHQDAELAPPGRDHLAAHEDVVAQVDEFLPALNGLLAHLGERHHRLDTLASARLQGREAELARVAAEDDAAGDADRDTGHVIRDQVSVLGAHPGDGRGDRQRHRVGLAAVGDQALALGEADGFLLGDVLDGRFFGGGRIGRLAHALLSSGRWRRCR